jgi:hypothetical protein
LLTIDYSLSITDFLLLTDPHCKDWDVREVLKAWGFWPSAVHASYESYAAHVGVPYGMVDHGGGVKERPMMTTLKTEEIYMRRWLSRSSKPSGGIIIINYQMPVPPAAVDDAAPTARTGTTPRFGDTVEAVEMGGGMFDITNQPIAALEMMLAQSKDSVKLRLSRRSPLLPFGTKPIAIEVLLPRQSGTPGDTPDDEAAAAFGLQLQQIDLRHEAGESSAVAAAAAAAGAAQGSAGRHEEL